MIFGNLPAGNYTLKTTAPGMVDKDGKAAAPTATSVVALSTNTLALQYDVRERLIFRSPPGAVAGR